MCGIVFRLSNEDVHEGDELKEWETLCSLNASRGPDAQGVKTMKQKGLFGQFFGSVLHLRGDQVAEQPYEQDGNILCWNGEIFEGLDISTSQNDGLKLFEQLLEDGSDVATILSTIEGPYAFVYYQSATSTLYFGRDPLGRRSLLIRKPTATRRVFTLASVSDGHAEYEEVSPEFLYSLSFKPLDETFALISIPREVPNGILKFISPTPLRRELPPENYSIPSDPISVLFQATIIDYVKHLDDSVTLRTQDIPRLASHVIDTARVSVLFSGGIDSSVVAFLAHRHLPLSEPIDLLNVAFENPRTLGGNQNSKRKHPRNSGAKQTPEVSDEKKYSVPDRITGLTQVAEFRRLVPERAWNFVEINVSYEESTSLRPTIEQLMAPSRTIMDLSLAQALYFASRGKGVIQDPISCAKKEYTSPARVILSGLGADELLGGYVRHRNAFKHAGWQGLLDELQLDVDRIHTRNLGRDDRIISSHGKETRYPFLSMSLLSYLSSLPLYLKVDPRVLGKDSREEAELAVTNPEEQGYVKIEGLPGDKLLHRLAARHLGLLGAAGRAKRAMQFGSRSARMEEGAKKIKGGTILGEKSQGNGSINCL